MASRKANRTVVVPADFGHRYSVDELKRISGYWKLDFPDCEVEAHSQYGKLVRFDIFGSGPNLDATVRSVNKWIGDSSTKSSASLTWAKMPAWEYTKWYDDKLREEERERKQIFKGTKPEEGLPDKVEVPWPQELMDVEGITPRDVFGNKLESLDSIRTDCEVFITLLPDRRGMPPWQVEICGYHMDNVLAGEEHYRNMIQRVQTQKLLGYEKINIILDETEGINVILEQAEDWWPRKSFKIAPRLLPAPMSDEPGTFRKEGLHFTQLERIQSHIQRSLETIRFEKGSYDFTIRYGSLALGSLPDSEIGKEYSMNDFRRGINTKVECHVVKWLANYALGNQLMARLMDDHLLEPISTSTIPSTPRKVHPTLRGTWILRDPGSPTSKNQKPVACNPGRPNPDRSSSIPDASSNQPPIHKWVVVQIDWTEDEEGGYEKMPTKFYTLKPGNTAPTERMYINLLELGDGKGWHFALESMTIAPKSTLSHVIVSFAERVKLRPSDASNPSSTQEFAQWSLNRGQHVAMARLDKIFTFGIKKTGYQVEVLEMWYGGKAMPCRGLMVRHREWTSHLSELERLPQGRGVDYGDIIETFLPDNGITSEDDMDKKTDLPSLQNLSLHDDNVAPPRDGIRILVDKLLQLSELINRSDVSV